MPEKTAKTVSEDDCKTRQQTVRWMVSAGIGLMGVVSLIGGWLGWLTLEACAQATTAQSTIDQYIAKDEQRSIDVRDSLKRIANTQIRIDDKLDKFYKSLLEKEGK